jgi:hypothetical protein
MPPQATIGCQILSLKKLEQFWHTEKNSTESTKLLYICLFSTHQTFLFSTFSIVVENGLVTIMDEY